MAPATGTALLILGAFVLPGFVAILVKERIYEVPNEQQPFDRVLQTLYYSLLVYSLPTLVAVVGGVDREDFERLFRGDVDLRLTAAIAIGIALLTPMGIAYAGRRWMISDARQTVLDKLKVSITHRTPSSWSHWSGRSESGSQRRISSWWSATLLAMSKFKSSGAKSTTTKRSRSAATGRFIGERGRRATVARPKPEALVIRERKAG
jgi:hypothetical protein